MAIGRRTARSLAPSLIACGVLIATLLPAPAAGALYMDDYRDSRSDPDPGPGTGSDDTIRIDRTIRSVWTSRDGRRWLTVVVAPFFRGTYMDATVRLDTDGDRSAEYVMTFASRDMEGEGCFVRGGGRRTDGHFARLEFGDYPEWAGAVACRVPLSSVEPTARIAWRVGVYGMVADPELFDRAPNVGWYV